MALSSNKVFSLNKPSFDGSFESMAPELDASMVRKWLRNIGDTSEKPKLKDLTF